MKTATLNWYNCLPPADRKQWNRYAHEEPSGDLTIIAPDGDRDPPPGPGNWRHYGLVDGRATWGIKGGAHGN